MGKNNLIKKITAFVFLSLLFIWSMKNSLFTALANVFNYLGQSDAEALSEQTLEEEYTDLVRGQKMLINLNGAAAALLNMQGLYSSMGMYITEENYIVSASDFTSTDYEYSETVDLEKFLTENGIQLLYVNEPTKYTDDSLFSKSFGVESYSNRNMDRFLERIRAERINTVDIRENMAEEGLDAFSLFYRTDHHWTVPAALWATQKIADGLNEYCGYDIDTSIYDRSNFTEKEWKNCWLGEQGRKVAESYVGLDDYTELKPDFETSFTFKNYDGSTWDGSFDDFINEEIYNTENDVYENGSWHYSYSRINCINNRVEKGKVLILGDSYDYLTHPFLALGVREVDSLILREYDDSFSLRDYILENGYDTVIIAYAQFMLGAHDDTTSANYRMYTFE